MVEKYTGHPALIHFSARLIQNQNIEARDVVRLARAFQRFAQDRVRYFREFPERWQSPIRTIIWGIGDCDDKTILISSGLRGFRVPMRAKFVRLRTQDGRRVSHVYPQAKLNGQWTSLESVRPVPLGFDFEAHARRKGVPVKAEYIGDK
jgi:transglutaminase-like putative cysteine protease